jgi:ATP/maltotriose-dependent transcriptional regulator MalT
LRRGREESIFPPGQRQNSSFAQGVFIMIVIVMAMTFTFRENFENFDAVDFEGIKAAPPTGVSAKDDKIQIFAEKLRLPETSGYIARPRLDRLLKRSLEQVGVVLVTGRAGTGKSSIAANFARNYENKVWFRIEAADADWRTFSRYLSKGLRGSFSGQWEPDGLEVRTLVEKLLAETAGHLDTPRLIVLDDIHHVFDTQWFHEFFSASLQALPPDTHLILLSRGKPTLPLWRLRSKQVLTVIEEKIIAFDLAEASKLCESAGIPPDESAKIYAESFGRIGKLKALIDAA